MRAFGLLIAAVVLAGCSTRYGDPDITGHGVTAEQLSPGVYRNYALGNGFTSAERVEDYALLKAAETTLAAGATHFVVTSMVDKSVHQRTMPIVHVAGGAAIVAGGGIPITHPAREATIRIVRVKAGDPLPAKALAAREIVRTIGAKLKPS